MTSSEREATKQTIIQMVSSLETDGAIDRVYKIAKHVWIQEDMGRPAGAERNRMDGDMYIKSINGMLEKVENVRVLKLINTFVVAITDNSQGE